MLKQRIATAAVMLAVFMSALFLLPTSLFAAPVAAVVAAGAYEWAVLVGVRGAAGLVFSGTCAGLFAATIWGWQAVDPSHTGLVVVYALASVFWILVVPFWLSRGFTIRSKALALAIGLVVVVPAGLSVVSFHSIAPQTLLMLLVLIWGADTSAYFIGRAFGRHKLAPAISPGKTWEGVAGAQVATLVYAVACVVISPSLQTMVQGGNWAPFLGVASLLCAISIVGDLFESLIKRQAMVKDSGTLLPGHGGVLDRIDSITSTVPVAALLFYVLAGGA